MKLNFVVVALLSSLIAVSTAEARGPYGSINVGNWKGGAYTNDQTGEFTHCAAGAGYDSGIYFMVTIDQGARMGAGLPQSQMDSQQQSDLPDRADVRRSASVQRSGRGHQREFDPRAHADRTPR